MTTQVLPQQLCCKLLALLPEPPSKSLTSADSVAAAARGILAEAPLLRAVLSLPPKAHCGVAELLASLPAACRGLQHHWAQLGVPPGVAMGCSAALLEAALRLKCFAPAVRLLAGGPAAVAHALEWLTPIEAAGAAVTFSALGAPSAPALLQMLLGQLLNALPADDEAAEEAILLGRAPLPSARGLLSAALWTAVYNDRGGCVSALWPLVVAAAPPGTPPSRGRTPVAVATLLGHASALGALLALTPPWAGCWGRALPECILNKSLL